jgi:hypothetical protein
MDQERRAPSETHTVFHYDDSGDRFIIERKQDVEVILKENREKRLADDGYTADRSMKRIAQIPLIIVEKWLKEEGWNALDPNESERVMQKLDDPDWQYLKTSEGKAARKVKRNYYRGGVTTKAVYLGDPA